MNNSQHNKNKALQYMKILKEYDQADSLYDNTVYQPDINNRSNSTDPTFFAEDPTQPADTSSDPSAGTKQPGAPWYSALVSDAWEVVQKSVETSDQVLSTAWNTVESLGNATKGNNNSMLNAQSQHSQGSSTNLVFPQSKEARAMKQQPASLINSTGRSKDPPPPEMRQPAQAHHGTMNAGGIGKRMDPEETSGINKEKKEQEAKKRAARYKKKGATNVDGIRKASSSSQKNSSSSRKVSAGQSVATGPKAKKITKEPPGARKDPPGAARAGANDDATVAPVRSRNTSYPITRKQLERQQQPKSIVRQDLEDKTSLLGLSMLPITECTGGGARRRTASPIPLRPCDIPRGSEIKKKNESILAGLQGDFFTNALKPFGL